MTKFETIFEEESKKPLQKSSLFFKSLPELSDYKEIQEKQKLLVEDRAKDLIPNTILFLEHHPVVTRGRGLQKRGDETEDSPKHMPVPKLPDGVQFCETERGGDLTYHGPGQLVIYPICKLDGSFPPFKTHDVAGAIRALESILHDVFLEACGLKTFSKPGSSGVWIAHLGMDRKLVSVGIAVKKWVMYHGVAINVVNDLAPYQMFSPCGFGAEVMISLKDLLPSDHPAVQLDSWREFLEEKIYQKFCEYVS